VESVCLAIYKIKMKHEESDDKSFVMRRLYYENVHKIYAKLSTFINGENEIVESARTKISFLPNFKSFPEGDKLILVARFLHSEHQ